MQNSQFFNKFLLELLANWSTKYSVQKFSLAWILQVVKVRWIDAKNRKEIFAITQVREYSKGYRVVTGWFAIELNFSYSRIESYSSIAKINLI